MVGDTSFPFFGVLSKENISVMTEMKDIKIRRRFRFSESFANLFAKGRMRVICAIAFLVFAAASITSCSDDEDGDWDPMVWKAEVPVQKTDGVYIVPTEGAVLSFSCLNYSHPWMGNALSTGEHYYPPREANDYHSITADWFKAEVSGNKLKVAFEGNATKEERPLELTVTAGDIFHTFKFRQYANR